MVAIAKAELDSPAIREALEDVRKANFGVLSPEKLLLAASNASSPLHQLFQWDDAEAGKAYRLAQARHIIKIVVVKPSESKALTTSVIVRSGSAVSECASIAACLTWEQALKNTRWSLDLACKAVTSLLDVVPESIRPDVVDVADAVEDAWNTLEQIGGAVKLPIGTRVILGGNHPRRMEEGVLDCYLLPPNPLDVSPIYPDGFPMVRLDRGGVVKVSHPSQMEAI